MLASLREAAKLWFREKTGLTAAFVALSLTAVTALATAFVFLCVSGYQASPSKCLWIIARCCARSR